MGNAWLGWKASRLIQEHPISVFSVRGEMCYKSRMKPERAIFEDNATAEAAAEARALDDIQAGRVVDHAEVAAWLEKWGSPEEKPLPDLWRA